MICVLIFFFNDTATTEIYTLSLHDALPISIVLSFILVKLVLKDIFRLTNPFTLLAIAGLIVLAILLRFIVKGIVPSSYMILPLDRKSTRLNSSHANISYAVFCLKKNNITSS